MLKHRKTVIALIASIIFFSKTTNIQASTRTANQYYQSAASYSTTSKPYEAFNIYKEAYNTYPTDYRFVEGMNSAATTILRWSVGSHRKGNFSAAINGYNTVINSPANSYIKQAATINKQLAVGKKATISANEFYAMVLKVGSSNPYEAFDIFNEALPIYPNDKRFMDGVNNRAQTILLWSKGSHKKGNFTAAIKGYKTIMNSSYVSQNITNEAKKYLGMASQKKTWYTENEYYTTLTKLDSNKPYEALDISIEANEFYPSDKRFINEINKRAAVILSWSKGSQKKGNFTAAIKGYKTIISSPNVSSDIINEAREYLEYANKKKIYYTADEYYNMMSKYTMNQPYDALSLLIEANSKYPKDQRFIKEINNRAKTILSWSKGSHKKGNFTSAINGYQIVFNAPTTELGIKNEAAALLVVAKGKQPYNSEGKYVMNTNYSSTFEETLDKQMRYGGPLTDLYGKSSNGEYWQVAKRDDVAYYLNPNNFLEGESIYQFLKLSGQAGISETQLNNVLLNRGILQGKAKYFMEASIKHNVNEIYLISHSLLETGNGTSSLARGVNYGGKIVYNIYGVGAYDRPFYSSDGDKSNPAAWGAKYAYDHGWFTPEAAIVGGAEFIGKGYVNAGQDTLYKMKWNPENPANHQYATDIGWAVKQISNIKKLYDKCSSYILRFDIPIYKK